MGHDGEPEVEVIEESDISEAEDAEVRPRVLRAPRAPKYPQNTLRWHM